jgi:hypothetical protein
VVEWEAWRTDAAERLTADAGTPEAIAAVLASTLAGRPLLCDLLSEMASVLERNVSESTVRAFKAGSLDKVDALGAVVTQRLPGLDVRQGRETVAASLIIAAGLWPLANPAPRVSAIYSDVPELTQAHVDFEPRLRQLLAAIITGFLHGAQLAGPHDHA